MAAYGPDLDEGLPTRSVLRTIVTAALDTASPRNVTQPHNRDGILGRRLIQHSPLAHRTVRHSRSYRVAEWGVPRAVRPVRMGGKRSSAQ